MHKLIQTILFFTDLSFIENCPEKDNLVGKKGEIPRSVRACSGNTDRFIPFYGVLILYHFMCFML